jgi:rare lipoprotein A
VKALIRARARRLLAFGALACVLTAAATAAEADAQTGEPTLRASAREHVLVGRSVPVRGAVSTAEAGRRVFVQLRRGRSWATVARATTREGGRFSASWRPSAPGRYPVRVTLAGGEGSRSLSDPVTVYRVTAASWYGPGFYGRRTACGRTLTTGTLGVANRSLPCGTRVTFRYRGRTVTVPVIDRGPYSGGRTWDLTAATKRRLGFGSTGTVWSTK